MHHVAGPQRWFAARERLEGWRAALAAANAAEPPVVEGDWSAASGYAAGRALAGNPDVTAVFAANDDMAIGLIRALTEAGRRVPEEVSVVGFDDIPIAAYVTPPLTTVPQPFDAVARQGLALLVHTIEKPQETPTPTGDQPVGLDRPRLHRAPAIHGVTPLSSATTRHTSSPARVPSRAGRPCLPPRRHPCPHLLSRRTFLAAAGAVSLNAALAACGADGTARRRRSGQPGRHRQGDDHARPS